MWKVLKKFNQLFERKQKKEIAVFLMMVIGAFLEVLGVSLMVPLMSVIMEGDRARNGCGHSRRNWEWMINHPEELSHLGKEAEKTIRERYTYEAVCQQFLKMLTDIKKRQ